MVDSDFFQHKDIKARTRGNARVMNSDFQRVTTFPYMEGAMNYSMPSSKKSHKKEKRKKEHVNWTKETL